jgi:myo-inositol-1(or 4)-monophosphatase
MDSLIIEALTVARRAAAAASRIHRLNASTASILDAEEKRRSDYVSRTDREAEEAAYAVIQEYYPDHRVMAEESTDPESVDERALEGPVWIVDPLDGTANYLHGHPMYAASVALAIDGDPIVGVVDAARTNEVWSAGRGLGARKNGRPIQVSPVQGLRRAMVGTGFPFKAEHRIDEYTGQLGRVLASTAGVRRGGAAALDLAYLASGVFEGFWELLLNPWDFAAGYLLIQEAGGLVSRVNGDRLTLTPGSVMAANTAENLAALRVLVQKPAAGDPSHEAACI